MPAATARSVSGRRPATAATLDDVAMESLSTGMQAAYSNLLGYVNGMRKCCDMARFYHQLHINGDDFIADSIQHANDIRAGFASSSKIHESPTKLTGEMLKTPSRKKTDATRSRRAAANVAALRLKAYEESPSTAEKKRSSSSRATATAAEKENLAPNPFQQRLVEAKEVAMVKQVKGPAPLGERNGSTVDGNSEPRSPPLPPPKSTRLALGEIAASSSNARAVSSSKSGASRAAVVVAKSAKQADKSMPSSSSSSTQNEATAPSVTAIKAAVKRTKAASVVADHSTIENSVDVGHTSAALLPDCPAPRASTPPPASTSPQKPITRGMAAAVSIEDLQPIGDASLTVDIDMASGEEEEQQNSPTARQQQQRQGRDAEAEAEHMAIASETKGPLAKAMSDPAPAKMQRSKAPEDEEAAIDDEEDAEDDEGAASAVTAEQDLSVISEGEDEVVTSSAATHAATNSTSQNAADTEAEAPAQSKAEASRKSAAALLASKLKHQQQTHQQESGEKPAKRTLSSFNAKKSLSANAAAALSAAAAASNSSVPALPASTPAGPGFRSSFLQKSLRKRVEDPSQSKGKGGDLRSTLDDADEGDDEDNAASDAEATAPVSSSSSSAGAKSKVKMAVASMTKANTRANATNPSSSAGSAASTAVAAAGGRNAKRKSDVSHAPDAAVPSDPDSPPPTKMVKAAAAAVSRLASSSASKTPAAASNAQAALPLPSTSTKSKTAGAASKLEMFRNNLATVTRNGNSATSRGGVPLASSSAFARQVSASSPSKALPAIPVASALVPASDPINARDAVTGAGPAASSKLYPSLPEPSSPSRTRQQQQQQADKAAAEADSRLASPLSPKGPLSSSSSGKGGSTSPLRLPPRTASVRQSPSKSPERSRFGSPYRTLREGSSAIKMPEPTSPSSAGTRTLASLFGTPSHGSRLLQRPQAAADPTVSTTPVSSPGPKVLRGASKLQASSESSEAAGAPVATTAPAPTEGGERRQTRLSAAKAKAAETAAAATKADQSGSQSATGIEQASQSRDNTETQTQQATQPTQFFDALSQRADNSNEKPATVDDLARADDESSDSEGELTLEELSRGKDKPQSDPVSDKDGANASTQRVGELQPQSKAKPQQSAPKQQQQAAPPASTRKDAAPAVAIVPASPRKATNPQLASSQQGRLAGSIRGAPSAPNGRAMSQKASGALNSSIAGKFGTSKLPTSNQQPASSSSSSGGAPGSDTGSSGSGQASGGNSSGWGIGARLKGLLGLQSSTSGANGAGTAAPSSSASSGSSGYTPRPRAMSITQQQQQSNGLGTSTTAAAAVPAAQESRLNASTTSTLSQGSQASVIGGKPASLARAEMLRRKEAEEAEKKAKEKDERKRLVLAAKEKRAKAAMEEEQEREKRKRAREDTDRAKRLADVVDALPPVPGPATGVGASSSNAAVATTHVGRGSTAFNSASVKSKYMAGSLGPSAGAAVVNGNAVVSDNGKKRRLTTDRDGNAAAVANIPAALQSRPPTSQETGAAAGRQRAGSVGPGGAPKLVRTVSQSSIRPGGGAPGSTNPSYKPATTASMQQGAARAAPGGGHVAGQPIRFGTSAGPSASASRPPVSSSTSQQLASGQVKRASNFSAQNPFQQQQQQQVAAQKQQQQQQAAAAAAQLQKQRQMQAAAAQQYRDAYAAELADREREAAAEAAQQATEELPEVNSEYSDSDNEETVRRRATHPEWTQGDALQSALLAQATVDADEIFGIPSGPVRLEEMLPSQVSQMRIRRPRSSSANWSGPDGLAQWEIERYNKRLGIRSGTMPPAAGSTQPPQPPPGGAGAGAGAGEGKEGSNKDVQKGR